MNTFSVSGQYVDIQNRNIYPARVTVKDQRVSAIEKISEAPPHYLLPGFIDAHVHIESSMLVPAEFARLAVTHGTVATISDPHEIANVCGMNGVHYMIDNGRQVDFKFYFGAPSCVPATPFETAGGEISAEDVEELLKRDEIRYLAEMMNWPGTVNDDPLVLQKIAIAKKYGKPVDGHAPGLTGELAEKYISAGITTDHECFTKEEALFKLNHGMKILIREGSAAKNFEALVDLVEDYEDAVMFCSDDKHPDNLAQGHINELVKRAVAKGKDVFKVLKAACVNPVQHYKLDVGLLREGDWADFIVVKDLRNFETINTYINGVKVSAGGKTLIPAVENKTINNFSCAKKAPADFQVGAMGSRLRVIQVLDGQLITEELLQEANVSEGIALPNIEEDILKIAVVNRYSDAPPAVAFIKNFGLKEGAIASSVAHDSHNIIAVGVDDESLASAVNLIIDSQGGISVATPGYNRLLPLQVAGLMSTQDGYAVASAYTAIDRMAKEMGSRLSAPFMSLSFMALLVIPHIKLSDQGLFDGQQFKFVDLFL